MKKVLLGIGYWLIQLTWGILMTLIGLLVTGFCILFLKGKPHRNGFSYIVEVGGDWGGLELGAVSLCGSYSQPNGPCYNPSWYKHTACHEFGHSLQNLWWGPLFPFVISIPSAIRYWMDRAGKLKSDYEGIWFESQATRLGTKTINWINNK